MSNQMRASELLLLPNLLSLSRIALTPAVGYFLWRNDSASTLICLVLLVVAAITDALDGYAARKMGLISQLGLILDPLADKIFAAVLIIELILFREFPVWLAAAIIGRDLIILLAGLVILDKRKRAVGSTLTGKYTFFAIVILIAFSVIRFDSGVKIAAVFTLLLLAGSLLVYARVFIAQLQGNQIKPFADRKLYRWLRLGLTAIALLFCLWVYLAERFGILPLPW